MKVVIKIGSNIIAKENHEKKPLAPRCSSEIASSLRAVISQIVLLHTHNFTPIIVTSGAVAKGRAALGGKIVSKATFASLGQAELMCTYRSFFLPQHIQIAQILLSPNSIKNHERYKKLKRTLAELALHRIIPLINENDVTTLDDSFWDNDSLAAMIASLTGAQALLLLTNVDGLYAKDPILYPQTKIIREVKNVNLAVEKMASQETSAHGKGGMLSKLRAAKLATTCGIETYILNGFKPHTIADLLIDNKNHGTHFVAQKNVALTERKKWLMIGSVSLGEIVVDAGARNALENHKSLLAVGVRGMRNVFERHDFVKLADQEGEIFAYGLVNYSSKQLMPLLPLRDHAKIKKLYPQEIVHADNITLLT